MAADPVAEFFIHSWIQEASSSPPYNVEEDPVATSMKGMIVPEKRRPSPSPINSPKAFIVTLTLSENIQRESEESDSLKNTKNKLKNTQEPF